MNSLLEKIEFEATGLQKRSRLDGSIESLKAIDNYFDSRLSNPVPKNGDMIEKSTQYDLFCIGAYLGETLKENMLGSTWQLDESDPDNPIKAALILPDQSIVWPFERVLKRFYNGSEDGIYAYGFLITEGYYAKRKESNFTSSDPNKPRQKSWWKLF